MIEMPDGGEAILRTASQDVGKGATEAAVVARNAAIGVQSQQMAGAAAQLQAAAAGGGFHITPEAAATLIKACNDSLQDLADMATDLANVSQAPKLGSTPGAKVVAPFTQKIATNGQDGMAETIQNLTKTLNQMVEAYQKASTNYQQTEQDIAQAMKNQKA